MRWTLLLIPWLLVLVAALVSYRMAKGVAIGIVLGYAFAFGTHYWRQRKHG